MSDKPLVPFAVNLEVLLDADFFTDVMETASYGITYWAIGLDHEFKDGSYRIGEQEASSSNEGPKTLDVTPDAIKLGITRLLQGKMCNSAINTHLYQALVENDAGVIDAEVADAIIQAALFDDLVYG